MFRTLLVDDDFLVRAYLKMLDSWERAGYEIIRDVQDGEEAWRYMEEEPIDVVVTDISMPVMDGIQLIRRIREAEKETYIIVLSCHDEFAYVKEAMKLGADEYILKNALDENSLFEMLQKAGKQIQARRENTSRKKQTRKLIQMGSHTLKYHFFNGILSGTLKGTEREEKRLEAGIAGSFQNSAVITMFMYNWKEQSQIWTPLEAEEYSQTFRHGLVKRIESLLGEDGKDVEVIYPGAGVFCCFLDMSGMRRSAAMHQRLTDVAAVCFRYCKDEPYPFGMGVSNICFGEEGIRQAYQQARETMKLSFYEEGEILYFDSQKQITSTLPKAAELLYERIEEIKKGGKQDELGALWKRVLEESKKNRTDGKILIQWLKRLDQKGEISRSQEEYGSIWSIGRLEKAAEKYPQELFRNRVKIPAGVSVTVKYAVEFLHDHYRESISLQDAAEAAGVNPAYLSYLFKQEMKIGFSNYLQELRLECAKNLLSTTNDKIKDVARQAGFNDYHYFSKTFKKLCGMSPADYRRAYSE
ncbi:MAG: response regulator [Clostridiales bacterium]|nr:response regulator [Clostridiales bacterium]